MTKQRNNNSTTHAAQAQTFANPRAQKALQRLEDMSG